MRPPVTSPLATLCVGILAISLISSMELYSIKYVDRNSSRLVATSNYNYAFTSPKLLARNWRSVSVNGDQLSILTTTGQYITKGKAETDVDREFIEKIRDEILNDSEGHGITQYSSMSGGPSRGSFAMSSSGDQSGRRSSSYSSSGFSSMSIGNSQDDTTINYTDENNFSISKSSLPFNWCRLFYNGDLVTIVNKKGEVHMKSLAILSPEELAAVEKLKLEAGEMQRAQAKKFSETMKTSMESVSKVLTDVMGNLPKTYQNAWPSSNLGHNGGPMGPMGPIGSDEWPFGPNKNPFAAPGWPFGSGNNGGVFAYAV